MATTDWNWRLPIDPQDYPWDCAAASLAWALSAAGRPTSEQEVIAGLGPSRISPTLGLLDASGAGLVEYLAEIGVTAENDPDATWSDLVDAAGYQPMVTGGRAWSHWTGVRMGSIAANLPDMDLLILANPASGYMGVEQTMDIEQCLNLGPFSAVWFTAW
jgi:hypothetical protein